MKNMMRKWGCSLAMVLSSGMAAFAAQPDLPSFGMIGFAPGSQFLRLNVTNLRVPGFEFVGSPGDAFVGPCEVELSFSDGHGTVYKRSTASLDLQQSTHLDLTMADLPAAATGGPGRIEVLPSLLRDGGCTLVASVEVIATANNQTDGYVIRKDNNTNGLLPIYGLIGMAPASQFIRLNVSNEAIPGISTGTCEVELSFTDEWTNTLKRVETPLTVGTSAHLDLAAADLSVDLATPTHVEVLPSITYAGRCALNSTVEVIAIATGQTSASASQASFR